MSIMGLIEKLFGRGGEGLPKLPDWAGILDVEVLDVRTAAEWIIVTLDSAGMAALIDAARDRTALQLRGPGRAVTAVATKQPEKIVLDPEHGWVLPLSAAAAAELAALPAEPGENMLDTEFGGGARLAVVVDDNA